jgi:two-component system NtrC family sensor kinase
MSETAISLLLIDHESRLGPLLEADAAARGYRLTCVSCLDEALVAAGREAFQAALVDLESGPEPTVDALHQLKALSPDLEIIVLSAARSLAPAIRSYELAAFAFVPKPVESAQLVATIERGLERRRISLHNRRLFWELQTINEIAQGIGRSLELDAVLTGALQRIVRAFNAASASIRFRDDGTGRYEHGAVVEIGDAPTSSEPRRNVLSVPMMAGEEVVGTLAVAAPAHHRFHFADERLLTIIAGQIVVAVQNVRLHESVRRGKSEWERTFDAIGDPIAVFDREGRLLRGNVALASFLGRPVTELPQASCCEVGFCGGGCPNCAVGHALRTDTPSAVDLTLPSGRIFTVTTFPVGGTDDASVVQVAKDVTEQMQSARELRRMSDELATANAQLLATVQQLKSTQAQLLQAEKLSAIGQLVAGVAHELNNPLTSVIGYAQLLEQELLDPDAEPRTPVELGQDLRRIAEESERAARIVRNLLAFARRQTAARVPQDVEDLVSRVLSLRSYDFRLHDVELVAEFEPGLPQVVADGAQLQQALLNLILNAEQAMRNSQRRRLRVGARFDRQADAVELFVSDTGHGIDQANLSRIFDPFFTTRDVGEGTGLGLSICYGILRDHGGEVIVESRVQVGTTFSIRLPARTSGPAARSSDILVAHSDQGQRDFLSAALTAWGYTVTSVSRADEALAQYSRNHLNLALIERALLRADPQGWGALRGRPGSPLVLLAAAGNDGEMEEFVRERVHGVLATPFQLRSLRATVRAFAKEKEYA